MMEFSDLDDTSGRQMLHRVILSPGRESGLWNVNHVEETYGSCSCKQVLSASVALCVSR
jgi:hypothetical protein